MPRPYQKDCIEAALNFSKGIIRSATASGKSLVIAYIILNLLENALAEKCIIIVPSKGLIAQFYQDLIDYGFVPDTLGMVFSKRKQWDRDIIISTWQSLSRNAKKLDQFDCIICDEVHGAKAHVMKFMVRKPM
jgi:superfamily II DNA or RNA helicase